MPARAVITRVVRQNTPLPHVYATHAHIHSTFESATAASPFESRKKTRARERWRKEKSYRSATAAAVATARLVFFFRSRAGAQLWNAWKTRQDAASERARRATYICAACGRGRGASTSARTLATGAGRDMCAIPCVYTYVCCVRVCIYERSLVAALFFSLSLSLFLACTCSALHMCVCSAYTAEHISMSRWDALRGWVQRASVMEASVRGSCA